jgi:UDP-glucose 4-epimerase
MEGAFGQSHALVTGGAGFIGSHVVDELLARGYDVTVVDDLSTGLAGNVAHAAQLVELDIVDGEALGRVVAETGAAFVCHLAAQSSVTVSVKQPTRDLASNVQGTFNVCQAAKAAGATVVFASTGGALYGDRAPIPSSEAVLPEPLAPYGASKLAGEAYVATWRRFHGLPNAVLRLGNVYGPRQRSDGEAGVVAIFSDTLLRGESPRVYGDGRQTRDYVHVSDVARAFADVAEARAGGTFNVGWGVERSVLDLLGALQRAAGTEFDPRFEPLRAGELLRSALDSRLLAATIGWRPEVEFARGLAETFRAYAAAS